MQKPLENLFGKKKNKNDKFDVQEITDEKVIDQLEQNYNTITNVKVDINKAPKIQDITSCLLYTSPSPRDTERSRMPSSA